jgi:hypothetical protein
LSDKYSYLSGLITTNTDMKYQNRKTFYSKDIGKVKVFNTLVKQQGQGHKVKPVDTNERSCQNKH